MTSPTGIPIDGVKVGHWTEAQARTGCTAIHFPVGTVASYECRGGAPAARELALLEPDKSVTSIDALLLTGGSAFGLAAADGVMRHMEELGRGVPTPGGAVPIVPTLGLFDLAVGDGSVRPASGQGYAASAAATSDDPATGQVGAGTGAMVGHWRGPDGARPGGIHTATRGLGDVVVWTLLAVNAFGDVDDGTGPVDTASVGALQQLFDFDRTHTTIGTVVTNARLDKVGCRIVAQGAHDGLARAITPPHTRFDGDAFVAAATGQVEAHVDVVRLLALAAVTDAIRSAGDL
ncbi:P1 family peptidase [Flexivirga sp. B27]